MDWEGTIQARMVVQRLEFQKLPLQSATVVVSDFKAERCRTWIPALGIL